MNCHAITAPANEIEQLRAENKRLREIEWRYRRFLKYAREFVYLHDLEGNLLQVNRDVSNRLGYSEKELLKLNIRDFVHSDDLSILLEAIHPTEGKYNKNKLIEARVRTRNGDLIWVEINAWRVLYQRRVCIQGVARDITDRKQVQDELKRKEQFLKTVVNTAPSMIFVKNKHLKFTFVNSALAKIYGTPEEELIGKTDDGFPPTLDEIDAFRSDDVEVLATGGPKVRLKESVTDTNGVVHWFKTIKIRIHDPDGSPQVLGVATDITDLVEVEKELEKQRHEFEHERDLLHTLMSSSLDAIYFKDTEGRFQRVNQALAKFLGAATELDVKGKTDFDFFPKEYAEQRQKEEQQMLMSRNPLIGLIALTRSASGEYRWRSTTKVPLLDKNANIVGLLGISRDIQDLKEIEEKLRQQSEMLTQILNAVPQKVFWKDTSLIYQGCNHSFAKRHELSDPREIIGKTDHELSYNRHDADRYRADDLDIIQTNKAKLQYRESQVLRDGTRVILETSKVPLHDSQGEVIGVLGIYEDISENLKHYEDLVRFVSHNLKSRIALLETNLVGLKRYLPGNQQVRRLEDAINILKEAVFRANHFSLLGTREREVRLSINEIIQQLTLAKPDERLLLELDAANPYVLGVRLDLVSALLELYMNATRFTPPPREGGLIRIRTEITKDRCVIHFRNNGKGIQKHNGDNRSFFWPRDTRRPGVGLAFVKYVIEKHVGVFTEIGQGGKETHFVIDLPLSVR